MTRVVLQGLASGPPVDKDVIARAKAFLRRCQNEDGGFYFSPVVLGANKASAGEKGEFKSYGSTTADGILAMLAVGMPPDNPEVQKARDWLVTHHRTDRVPGIPEKNPWADGLRFYYLSVSAQAFRRLGVKEAPAGHSWRKEMVEALLKDQRKDGSWSNPQGNVKEDDPLIATPLALGALVDAL